MLWFSALLGLFNRAAIFHPESLPEDVERQRMELGAQEVWLRGADGTRLDAWLLPAEEPRLVTLFLHGNGGSLPLYAAHLREIRRAGSSVLAIDYRGYGASEGRPSEEGLYADADAGYAYLLEAGFPPQRIVLHGQSLGTALAVDLAARRACGGVVLDSPFPSIAQIAATILPFLDHFVIYRFDSAAKIGRLRAPLLIVHGAEDRTVPVRLGRRLFEAAPEPKTFWEIAGAGHEDMIQVAGPEYARRLSVFYDSLACRMRA